MTNERKVALVTGASSGIGRATAVRLAHDGYRVVAMARRQHLLDALLDELDGDGHMAAPADYTDLGAVRRAAQSAASRYGRIDALVNAAGVFGRTVFTEVDNAAWRGVFNVMLDGALSTTRAVLDLMPRGGRIVHVTSIHSTRAEFGSGAYAAAKAAIEALVRGLAIDLADAGVLVNAIAPGFVDTPMSVVDGVNEIETEAFRRDYVDGHLLPLRRAAAPEEIAGVAAFLLGPDSSYMTGQSLVVDGGLTLTF